MFEFLPDALRLSFFPSLLTWWGLAPFILRLVLGFVSIKEGWALRAGTHVKLKALAYVEILAGILVFIGFFTQPACLVLVLISASLFGFQKSIRPFTPIERYYRVLHIAIAVSLIFLGPGFWSIDLPL